MTISSTSSWKDFFLKAQKFDYLNFMLQKLQSSMVTTSTFETSFKDILKNLGITFLSLDPSEKKMQLFHRPTVFGGTSSDSDEKLIAINGLDNDAFPVEIILKSVKDSKGEPHSAHKFSLGMTNT